MQNVIFVVHAITLVLIVWLIFTSTRADIPTHQTSYILLTASISIVGAIQTVPTY